VTKMVFTCGSFSQEFLSDGLWVKQQGVKAAAGLPDLRACGDGQLKERFQL